MITVGGPPTFAQRHRFFRQDRIDLGAKGAFALGRQVCRGKNKIITQGKNNKYYNNNLNKFFFFILDRKKILKLRIVV